MAKTDKGKAGEVKRSLRWRAKHRASYNAYMREYMRLRRQGGVSHAS